MSAPARLSLRAPPHLPFIQGWPGIPANPARKAPGIHGTVELRLGSVPIKAKWVRVEFRKYELLPSNINAPSGGNTSWDHVGEIINLWQVGEGKEWDSLETADFKFFLPLPENIPPTVELLKGGGIRYELVAALCYRQKGGLLKKESAPIMKISEPIRITKHELHSAWPLYNIPETRLSTVNVGGNAQQSGQITLTVSRPSTAFGPNDRILLTANLKSSRPTPFKLKGFDTSVNEILTFFPHPQSPTAMTSKRKSKPPPPPITKTRIVCTSRSAINESVGRGGEKSARIELLIPVEKLLFTVKNARMIEVNYEIEVKAVCDGIPEGPKVSAMKCVVGPFARPLAQQACRDIGYFEPLCPPMGGIGNSTPSSSSRPISEISSRNQQYSPSNLQTYQSPPQNGPYPPQSYPAQGVRTPGPPQSSPPVQGFIPRNAYARKSSAGSTTTTTTTTPGDFSPTSHHPSGGGHQFSTVPMQNGRGQATLAFPTPNPANRLVRSGSVPRSDSALYPPSPDPSIKGQQGNGGFAMSSGHGHERSNQSEMGHGDMKRYSTGTNATFGNWDRGLRPTIDGNGSAVRGDDQTSTVTNTPVTPNSQNSIKGSPHRQALSSPDRSPPNVGGSSRTPDPATNVPIRKNVPGSWASAEAEKTKLYDLARARAAATQQAGGASLDKIGLSSEDIPSNPPPEYAPPRPVLPGGKYIPPSRPVSMYSTTTMDRSPSTPPVTGTSPAPTFGGSNTNTSATPPPKPPIPVDLPKVYLSAAEEKEQQKLRYENASRRVVSGGQSSEISPERSGPSSSISGPSNNQLAGSPGIMQRTASPLASPNLGQTTPNSPPPFSAQGGPQSFVSAAEEKERLRYQAAISSREQAAAGSTIGETVASSIQGSPVPLQSSSKENQTTSENATSGPSHLGSSSYNLGPVSPIVESANGSGSSSKLVATAKSDTIPLAFMSAAEEKEMMKKRYEEAAGRVAIAQSATISNGGSQTSQPASPMVAGSSSLPEQSTSSIASPAVTQSGYMSAAEEKEMMKRRFEEATSRVARAQRSSSGVLVDTPSTPPAFHTSPARSQSTVPTSSGSSNYRSPTALPFTTTAEEKEAMRRRYEEAMERVARAQNSPTPTIPSTVNSPMTPPLSNSTSYPSAIEEKEIMRQRFESAQNAVNSRRPAGSPVINGNHNRPPSSYNPPGQRAGFSHVKNASISSVISTTTTTSPPDSPLIRDPTVKAGKARAVVGSSSVISNDGPPPPLPAKPPLEYINLLSPVDEVPRGPFSSLPGSGSGSGNKGEGVNSNRQSDVEGLGAVIGNGNGNGNGNERGNKDNSEITDYNIFRGSQIDNSDEKGRSASPTVDVDLKNAFSPFKIDFMGEKVNM